MRISRKDKALILSLLIDDTNAQYPILVDPLASSADWSASGGQAGANFGHSVATAGDVNGDGYSDVVVGAYTYNNGYATQGRAFLFHGTSTGLQATSSWIATGTAMGDRFGESVATAGDSTGDGYSDVIIGSPNYSNGGHI